jgi:hypothetical protein
MKKLLYLTIAGETNDHQQRKRLLHCLPFPAGSALILPDTFLRDIDHREHLRLIVPTQSVDVFGGGLAAAGRPAALCLRRIVLRIFYARFPLTQRTFIPFTHSVLYTGLQQPCHRPPRSLRPKRGIWHCMAVPFDGQKTAMTPKPKNGTRIPALAFFHKTFKFL